MLVVSPWMQLASLNEILDSASIVDFVIDVVLDLVSDRTIRLLGDIHLRLAASHQAP